MISPLLTTTSTTQTVQKKLGMEVIVYFTKLYFSPKTVAVHVAAPSPFLTHTLSFEDRDQPKQPLSWLANSAALKLCRVLLNINRSLCNAKLPQKKLLSMAEQRCCWRN